MAAHSDHPAHPFDAITAKFNRNDDPSETPDDTATQSSTGKTSKPRLVLPSNIQWPVIILSNQMRIAWQNLPAVSTLWQYENETIPDNSLMDVFDLVLSTHFQTKVHNWRQWAAFFIQQALAMMPKEMLEKQFSQKDDRQAQILQSMLTDFEPLAEHQTFSGNLQQHLPQDLSITYQVVGIGLEKGRLLVFEPLDSGQEHLLSHTQSHSHPPPSILMRTYKHPVKMSIYLLCARLNNADIIADEMLAKDYGRLLNRLWSSTREIIEQHKGMYVQIESGEAMSYFMPSEKAEQNPLQVIQCALALKNQMNDLGREWKIQMNWLHDIELNIGIHCGIEYITSLPTSIGDNLLSLGNTLALAKRLSALSQAGQIWTTKTIIDQIAEHEIESLRFGTFRNEHQRQIFIPNSFTRICDIAGLDQSRPSEEDEFSLKPVTLVFDYEAPPQTS